MSAFFAARIVKGIHRLVRIAMMFRSAAKEWRARALVTPESRLNTFRYLNIP